MRIRKRNRVEERRILTAMIVDGIVLGHISSKWNKQLFKTRWANLIGGWCVKYHNRYKKAPMKQIESLYESWSAESNSEETVKLIERFLSSLSNDYEILKNDSNSDYILDLAGRYFNRVRIENTIAATQSHLDIGSTEDADEQLTSYNRIELGVGTGIDVFQDEMAIKEAFESRQKPLLVYKGALGRFFGGALERDALISFMAPEKRGKTFWLLDVAYRAMQQHRKVAFFEAGDMSQNQIMRRLMVRVSQHPMKRSLIYFPKVLERNGEEKCASVERERIRFKKGLSYKIAKRACKKLMTSKLKSKESLFKLSCHANSTLSVSMIKSTLQSWERDNWIPDVIVIDYTDILDMNYPGLEGRDRINETWKQLRGLSQTYHCLVVTATQSDATSYKANTLNKSNFSEDKRKNAHVNGMIGINASKDEQENGLMRLNWVVLRESEFNEDFCVHVATCLGLANPSVMSCF